MLVGSDLGTTYDEAEEKSFYYIGGNSTEYPAAKYPLCSDKDTPYGSTGLHNQGLGNLANHYEVLHIL